MGVVSMKNLREAGFTLIELLVALVILGLLAGLVGPQFFGKIDSSKVKTSGVQVEMLKMALQTYRLDAGQYPPTLQVLWQRPTSDSNVWSGPYIDGAVPLDPWDRAYQYSVNAGADHGFYLFSFGADGVAGGEGMNADIGYFPQQMTEIDEQQPR